MDATALGLKAHDDGPDNIDGNADDAAMDATDLTTQENAQDALARIDVAIKQVSTEPSHFWCGFKQTIQHYHEPRSNHRKS